MTAELACVVYGSAVTGRLHCARSRVLSLRITLSSGHGFARLLVFNLMDASMV